jgi:predicted Zn-dependent protease
MSISHWNLDQLKTQLSQSSQVKSWIVTQEHVHRRERYFMLENGGTLVTDQDRDVRAQNIQVKIAVKLEKPGRQGEISKKLFPSLPLHEQLESAIEAARQTDHQEWTLPSEPARDLPSLRTSDPRMAEDLNRVMDQVTEQIAGAVSKKRPSTFNSAELFLSVHDRELHLSNGLVQRYAQSRIYTETAYSFSKKNSKGEMESDEYLNTRWAVNLDDLKIAELYDETAERAEHSLGVHKPETGKYPVIVDAEVLATLFNGHITQLTAVNSYNSLPFVKPGQELIPGCTGDPITLSLDPGTEYGADTSAVSEQGVAQKRLKLVDRNKVLATSSDKQYADYLAAEPTTARGNVVVDAGTLSHDELARSAPKVIEILQFSGLFADPNSGTFSSEIRLARLFDNVRGTVTYLKEIVKHSHFSSNSFIGQGYVGPRFALLSDVSIVG